MCKTFKESVTLIAIDKIRFEMNFDTIFKNSLYMYSRFPFIHIYNMNMRVHTEI